jgi:hypothetical protein
VTLADLYVNDQITVETLERYIEIDMARAAPLGTRIPPAWQPIPDCSHQMVDITPFGSPSRQLLCMQCGTLALDGHFT